MKDSRTWRSIRAMHLSGDSPQAHNAMLFAAAVLLAMPISVILGCTISAFALPLLSHLGVLNISNTFNSAVTTAALFTSIAPIVGVSVWFIGYHAWGNGDIEQVRSHALQSFYVSLFFAALAWFLLAIPVVGSILAFAAILAGIMILRYGASKVYWGESFLLPGVNQAISALAILGIILVLPLILPSRGDAR